jgi:Arc/MetJ-type ribon-helix-helix transcriptional regulator
VKKENMVPLNVRVPPSLKELAQKFVALDAHKDVSELTRDALREKIRREAPDLYAELFKETAPTA